MKTILLLLLAALWLSGFSTPASAQVTNNPPEESNDPPAPPPDDGLPPPEGTLPATGETNGVTPIPMPPEGGNAITNPPVTSTVILPTKNRSEPVASMFVPPAEPIGTNSNELLMNFRNAPLDMVLNYLSDAAGFIIVLNTQVSGNVTILSTHPVTQDEAVDLLNAELNRNNYAAIRDGRVLTIVDKNEAKTRNIPVRTGNIPANIPKNDEIVTQIIPIRFVEARQLVSDLSLFVSPQATVVANETGNSIIVTDTQANIRHLAEIIKAVDDSAEAETEIRVFRLKYANPTDVATELTSVFPNSTSGNSAQSPIRFGGGGGGRGNFFARMMAGAGNDNNSNDRMKKATQVTAVADARIQAVIVTAPKDLMIQIAGMMTDLDVSSERDQGVYVFQMMNGDPQQAVQVLQNMFQSSGTTRNGSSSSTQNSALQQRAQNATTTMGTTSTTSGVGGTGIGGGAGGGGGRQF